MHKYDIIATGLSIEESSTTLIDAAVP